MVDALPRSRLSAGTTLSPAAPALVYTHPPASIEAEIHGLSWSAGNAHIATTPMFRGAIAAWDATTGQHGYTLPVALVQLPDVRWSAQGRLQLLRAAKDKMLSIVDVASNQNVSSYQGYTQLDVFFLRAAHWSPDGRRVGSIGKDTSIDVWDAATGQTIIRPGVAEVGPADLGGNVFSDEMRQNLWQSDCSWSSDGGRILFWSYSGLGSVWDVQSGQLVTRSGGHWQRGRPTTCLSPRALA